MQRVAILVDGWNLLKAAGRLKRRVNLAELAHAALAHCPHRYIAFQRFYIGPNSGFGTAQRVERLVEEVRSHAKLEQQLRGPETGYEPRFMEAYKQLAAGRDVMVLEGGRSWREGYVAGLSPRRIVELMQAQVLIMLKYDQTLLADCSLAAQDYFGKALLGVLTNETPRSQADDVRDILEPYLARLGLPVLEVLPKDPMLAAPTVAELAEGLHAEILSGAEKTGELVENMLVGAMSAEAAPTYFRRQPSKAVITGGDRADLQLAALETSTRCLILTGNLYPSPSF